ncbi:MAG TPA: fused MFS/spermidine synthase [Planctomycetota bacterium]|nr:fused MFS/spermidine synthase [Planctomycetota bacterium]
MTLSTARRTFIVFGLFLISGACGLIYEVLWSKQLGLIFGNTVQSLSAVLTAFMGGLALGSYLGGRFVSRIKRPLLAYGVLEIIIGVYCALLPWVFSDGGPIVALYRALHTDTGSTTLTVARFFISFVLLLIPTIFMGATLPLLSQFLVASQQTMGRTVGALYATNSLGAVLGAAGTGFFLLPHFGKLNTNLIAVGCNVVLGITAILLGRNAYSRGADETPAAAPTGEQLAVEGPVISPAAVRAAMITFGVTGFAAMAMQIGWTRAISLATGSSTYAFSLIVSIFILGLSLGGFWGSRIAVRVADPLGTLGRILLIVALASVGVSVLLGYTPTAFFFLMAWTYEDWTLQQSLQALAIGLLLLVPTFFMGATTPLTMQVAARSQNSTGRVVGTVYAVNTIGAILGSFLGGILLIPFLQIQSTLEMMSLLYAVPGVVLIAFSSSRTQVAPLFRTGLIAVPLVMLITIAPRWNPMVMSGGYFLLRDTARVNDARRLRLLDAIPPFYPPDYLVYYKEGTSATVAVMKLGDRVSLHIGGKPDASNFGDMPTQVSSMIVPALLHPGTPEDILVIGLGSGVTTGSALALDTTRSVDILEMSPEVVEASVHFKDVNNLTYSAPPNVWIDTPKVRVLVNDGRNHLLLTQRKYDLISSEPSNPWLAGIGNLFTRESFQLARARLKPGGLMCQWLHSYSLEGSDFLSVLRTFGEVFPHIYLCAVAPGDYLMIGSETELTLPLERVREKLEKPALKKLLERILHQNPEEFLASLHGINSDLRRVSRNLPLITDDNMRLEFSAPKALHKARRPFLMSDVPRVPERILTFEGTPDADRSEFLRKFDLAVAAREHKGYIQTDPAVMDKHRIAVAKLTPQSFWAREYIDDDLKERAEQLMSGDTLRQPPDPVGALNLLKNQPPVSPYEKWPRQTFEKAILQNATHLLQQGRSDEAIKQLEEVRDAELQAQRLMLYARALAHKKDFQKAREAAFTAAAQFQANPAQCAEIMARTELAEGKPELAIKTIDGILRGAVRADPAVPPLYYLKAQVLQQQGKLDAALEMAAVASRLNPGNVTFYKLRSDLLTALGKHAEAAAILQYRAALLPMEAQPRLDYAESLLRAAGVAEAGDSISFLHRSRRAAREATALHPGLSAGWEILCRSFLALADADPSSALFYKGEARKSWNRALEINKGDAEKLPADLNAKFK